MRFSAALCIRRSSVVRSASNRSNLRSPSLCRKAVCISLLCTNPDSTAFIGSILTDCRTESRSAVAQLPKCNPTISLVKSLDASPQIVWSKAIDRVRYGGLYVNAEARYWRLRATSRAVRPNRAGACIWKLDQPVLIYRTV